MEMPGGYGTAATSFTLGAGRLSKPPITYSFSLSQGYDDNINSSPSHVQTVPEPTPVTFTVEEPTGQSRIGHGPPVLIFRTVTLPTPTPFPTPPSAGIVGSAVTQATLGLQVQKGTPRTIIVGDLNISDQLYWVQSQEQNYTGSLDLNFIHRISPRATLTIYSYAVYQKSPNFNLINAPTTNGNANSAYLNGNLKADLTYAWTKRISTVLTGDVNVNYAPQQKSQDLYSDTYGIQFRYTVTARNTVTAEIRGGAGSYPDNKLADSTSSFYLLGLDSTFSAKLRNTLSTGIENHQFTNLGGGQTLPYFESTTTFALPRGSAIQWTNRYGSEETATPGVNSSSFRSSLQLYPPIHHQTGGFGGAHVQSPDPICGDHQRGDDRLGEPRKSGPGVAQPRLYRLPAAVARTVSYHLYRPDEPADRTPRTPGTRPSSGAPTFSTEREN